jgi:hypothetical protein
VEDALGICSRSEGAHFTKPSYDGVTFFRFFIYYFIMLPNLARKTYFGFTFT